MEDGPKTPKQWSAWMRADRAERAKKTRPTDKDRAEVNAEYWKEKFNYNVFIDDDGVLHRNPNPEVVAPEPLTPQANPKPVTNIERHHNSPSKSRPSRRIGPPNQTNFFKEVPDLPTRTVLVAQFPAKPSVPTPSVVNPEKNWLRHTLRINKIMTGTDTVKPKKIITGSGGNL